MKRSSVKTLPQCINKQTMELTLLAVVAVYFTYGACSEVSPEVVLLHDLNADHDRRHLDAGLPAIMEFRLKREAGDVRLSLVENKNLNANAPMHEIREDADGKKRLIKKKHVPLEDDKFYHDKINGGAFSVRCALAATGPCRRMLTVGFAIDEVSLENKTPFSKRKSFADWIPTFFLLKYTATTKKITTGSLHIDGKNYDISPAPEDMSYELFDRSLDDVGTFHLLKEVDVKTKKRTKRSSNFNWTDAVIMEPPERAMIQADSFVLSRMGQEPTLYSVELFVVLDQFIYKRYYDVASPTETLTREEVTELNIRRDYSLVVNAVSLRYETIEDPELQIYCTVAGFLIVKEKNNQFNLPEKIQYDEEGIALTEPGYLGDLYRWFNALTEAPQADAVMVFTGAEIVTFEEDGSISYGIEGIAYLNAACWSTKVSLNEAHGSFFTTALIATHELGHNLGTGHDGDGLAMACAKSNNYIMSYLAFFYESTPYKVNPWRFSRCSIEQMKAYIKGLGSNNCLLDIGDPYDLAEYQEHLSKLPGERHSLDSQCKLIQGKDSRLCESTDMSNICLVIKCLAPDGSCNLYTAARGTTCGTNKWCIDGACVSKETVSPPSNVCEDRGHAGFSCITLRNGYFKMADFCHTWNASCCKTCKKLMGCWDGTHSEKYTGYVSWTKHGRTCQAWASQEPHTHRFKTDDFFPLDGMVAGAENNCRDPDSTGTPWCYTTNDNIRWEYCDIPICNIGCYHKSDTQQYKGKVSTIADGTLCQAWSEQLPHSHSYNEPEMFPVDESVEAANNYCRDPSKEGAPWCYTVNKHNRWDWCNVPRCD